MMRQPIRLEVKLEAKDVVRASRELLIRRTGVLFVAWCAIAGVGLYLFLAGNSGFGWPIVLAILAGAFGPPAILFELVIWNARRRFKQAAHELRPIHYCLHDDGMDVSSVKRSGWIPWEAFQDSVEIPSSFLLFLEKGEYYLLPKRCFERPNEVDVIRDMLQTEFAHRKKRK